jgi:hypothetical protein
MRLQLSALATRPLNTPQQAPFTPPNTKSKVNNSNPALAQRQGFRAVDLEKLMTDSIQIKTKIKSAKNNVEKLRQLERLEKLFRRAEYFITCLNNSSWLRYPELEKLNALRDPELLRKLGSSSGIIGVIKSLKPQDLNNKEEITALVENFSEYKDELERYLRTQFQNEELQTYLRKKKKNGVSRTWYSELENPQG